MPHNEYHKDDSSVRVDYHDRPYRANYNLVTQTINAPYGVSSGTLYHELEHHKQNLEGRFLQAPYKRPVPATSSQDIRTSFSKMLDEQNAHLDNFIETVVKASQEFIPRNVLRERFITPLGYSGKVGSHNIYSSEGSYEYDAEQAKRGAELEDKRKAEYIKKHGHSSGFTPSGEYPRFAPRYHGTDKKYTYGYR